MTSLVHMDQIVLYFTFYSQYLWVFYDLPWSKIYEVHISKIIYSYFQSQAQAILLIQIIFICFHMRSSHPEVFRKKGVLKNFAKFTGKELQLCQMETSAQMFSCEFCEMFKNTFLQRTPPVAVCSTRSVNITFYLHNISLAKLAKKS